MSSKTNHRIGATVLAAALKDPNGANLDRVQIIKGWERAFTSPIWYTPAG